MKEVTLVATNQMIAGKTIEFFCCFDEGKKLLFLEVNDLTHPSVVGQIHVARLQKYVKNVGCFLEIAAGEKVFLPEKEVKKAICVKRMSMKKTLCQGDLFLLGIKKDPLKSKDAVATASIELTDSKVALTYPGTGISVSKKALDSEKDAMLLAFSDEPLLSGYHLLIRTEGAKEDVTQLKEHVRTKISLMEELLTSAKVSQKPVCLYHGKHKALRLLDAFPMKAFDLKVKKILTDDVTLHEEMQKTPYADVLQPLYTDADFSLADLYRLKHHLKELTGKTVWMKSGGNIVIEPTEALTVIDVNTAKASEKKDLYSVNQEAAKIIMEQLRLRNLSGIILVDFMKLKRSRERQDVLDVLRKEAQKDPVKVQILGYTQTGLVEITREKIHPSLNQVLTGRIYCVNIS
ncbi:MAG: ribonuclease E/G [Lachnospiraceae bacterium]|nr:ribonuclease E/G [Lachnospiraceae bacterium]